MTSRYEYDDKKRLTKKEQGGISYLYFYDPKGTRIRKQEVYPNGQLFEETYRHDPFGNTISFTDIFGNVTQHEYDSFNRLTKVVSPEVYENGVGLVRPEYRYTYDMFDRVSSTKDPHGRCTQFSYTIRGDQSRIQYPDGSQDLFPYDTEGTLHRKVTRDGIVQVYLYDFLGRTHKVERFEHVATGPGEFIGE